MTSHNLSFLVSISARAFDLLQTNFDPQLVQCVLFHCTSFSLFLGSLLTACFIHCLLFFLPFIRVAVDFSQKYRAVFFPFFSYLFFFLLTQPLKVGNQMSHSICNHCTGWRPQKMVKYYSFCNLICHCVVQLCRWFDVTFFLNLICKNFQDGTHSSGQIIVY